MAVTILDGLPDSWKDTDQLSIYPRPFHTERRFIYGKRDRGSKRMIFDGKFRDIRLDNAILIAEGALLGQETLPLLALRTVLDGTSE